jgi:membrane protease YdiL (CAAX protease family)
MAVLSSVFNKDDPFNVWAKTAAPLAVLIVFPLVIFFQQFNNALRGESISEPTAAMIANEDAEDPGLGRLVIESKAIVKFTYFYLAEEDSSGKAAQRPFGDPDQPDSRPHMPRKEADKALSDLSKFAVSRTDRFRVAIVAGELLGPAEAHDRLEKLKNEAEPGGPLAADIGWLSPWYAGVAKGNLTPLPPDVQESLTERHGWFARLAISHQRPGGDPLRWEVVSGAPGVGIFLGLETLWNWGTFLLGTVLAIVTLVKIRGFEPAMVETDVPRSVYAEMFAVFLLGFLVALAMSVFVIGQTGAWTIFMGEAVTWSASAACLYPLLRGVRFQELCIDVGWTRGEGITKEIGAGLLGYLAGLPLHFVYHIILGAIEAAVHGSSSGEEKVQYPLFPVPVSASWMIVLIGVLGSCVWAPFFEETFFRGALHRYLPGKLGIKGRVLITALIFGAVHPYGPTGIIEVTLSGLVFGLLREWRGSLIAPMVAHFLNNATIDISEYVPVYLLH